VRSKAPADSGGKNTARPGEQHFYKPLMQQAYAASHRGGNSVNVEQFVFAAAVMDQCSVDPFEAMQKMQLTRLHTAYMSCDGEFYRADTIELKEFFGKMMLKLAHTFTGGLDALERYRGGGPGLTVQHVSVSKGSQAIVGNVTQNRGDPTEGSGSPAPTPPPAPPPPRGEEIIGEFTEVPPIAPGKLSRAGK
jgi:hypothetical protein